LDDQIKRNFYKNYSKSKKKAYSRYAASLETDQGKAKKEDNLKRIKTSCSVVRVLAHTDQRKIPGRQKKAHLVEIQVNGGSVSDKVDFAVALFEQNLPVDDIFNQDEMIDVIGVSKGKGY
jgi:large subunit ribosomal protein L3e